MAEFFTLATPASIINTKWAIDYITFDWTNKSITIRLIGDNGEKFSHTYFDVELLIRQLNKANLSTVGNSLQNRVFTRLKLDGLISGNVTGSPD